MGTVYGNHPDFYRRCLDELADAPWQIVLSTGGCFPAEVLGTVPPNCLVLAQVPQVEILKRCAAFVTHGGINSTHEALLHDVPLVISPQGADQFWIANRAVELGCGIRLGSQNVREAIEHVLAAERYRTAARLAGESMRAAGGHSQAADEIQEFPSKYQDKSVTIPNRSGHTPPLIQA